MACLGHCNYGDVIKLENVVNGVQIKNREEKRTPPCEICIQGKFIETQENERLMLEPKQL